MIVLHGGDRGGETVDEKSFPSSTKPVQVGDSPAVTVDYVFIEVPDSIGNTLLYRVEGDGGVFCGVKPKA